MPIAEKVIRNVRLTEDENRQLKTDAHAHNMNVSEYIRYLIAKERAELSRQ